MKKRVLILFLAVCILGCAFSLNAQAVPLVNEESGFEPSDSFKWTFGVLDALNIVDADGEWDLEAEISRAQFLDIYMKSQNTAVQDNLTQVFADVTAEHPYYASITTAYNLGLVSGFGDGTFRPDEPMLTEWAMKLVYIALGVPKENISFVDNGTVFAKGLTDGMVTPGAVELNVHDAIVVVGNLLSSKPIRKIFTGNSIMYEVDRNSDLTLLNLLFDAYVVKGKMTANKYTSLNSANGVGGIKIDNVVYSCSVDSYNELIGYNVRACVRESVEGNEIILAEIDDSKNNYVELTYLNEPVYENNKIVYVNDSGKEKEIKVLPARDVVYNGLYIEAKDITNDLFDVDMGRIVAIDSDNDGVYDCIKIFDYKLFAVGSYVKSNVERIYDRFDQSRFIDLEVESDRDFVVIYIDGERVDASALAKGDVISYIQNEKNGQKYVEIQCNRVTATGKIERIGGDEIVLDSKEYRMTDVLKNGVLGDKIQIGLSGTISFDYLGTAVVFERVESDELKYGFLMRAVFDENTSEEEVGLRIFTTDGGFQKYTVETLKIDDTKYTGDKIIKQLKKTRNTHYKTLTEEVYQIIVYKEADGILKQVYTTASGNDYAPRIDKPMKSRRMSAGAGSTFFGTEVVEFKITNFTPVITLPAPDENGKIDEDRIFLSKVENLTNGTVFQCEGYNCDSMETAELLLREYDQNFNDGKIYFVHNARKTLNDEDEVVNEFELMHAGYTYIWETKTETLGDEIGKGDLVQVEVDLKDRLVGMSMVEDFDSDEWRHGINLGKDAYHSNPFMMIGYAEAYDQSWLKMTWNQEKSTAFMEEPAKTLIYISIEITIFNVRTGVARRASASELANYVSKTGDDYTIYFYAQGGIVRDLVVYDFT